FIVDRTIIPLEALSNGAESLFSSYLLTRSKLGKKKKPYYLRRSFSTIVDRRYYHATQQTRRDVTHVIKEDVDETLYLDIIVTCSRLSSFVYPPSFCCNHCKYTVCRLCQMLEERRHLG
ncbi:hypothetical protein T310_10113, partial [Rasamsonia emersonii CBS 393.64]